MLNIYRNKNMKWNYYWCQK